VRALFDAASLAERDRRGLLRPQRRWCPETWPIVCTGVGLEAIRRAIADGLTANVAEIGRALCAGPNCGSCVPELQGIIERTPPTRAGRAPA
jgi:assimilatory nitrate reductase catalytic subunit